MREMFTLAAVEASDKWEASSETVYICVHVAIWKRSCGRKTFTVDGLKHEMDHVEPNQA